MTEQRGQCLLGDAGVFIGFTSLPFTTEPRFFKTEIKPLFSDYKRKVLKHQRDRRSVAAREFQRYFYRPRAYYVFGHYDLAVFSLIDDFMFGVRNFCPFSPYDDDSAAETRRPSPRQSFNHQIQLGPTPKFGLTDSIVNLARDTFLQSEPLPLVSISQFKLSNEFVISYGADFLRAAVKMMHQLLKESTTQWEAGSFKFILLESYSWHEITLLVFTDSYDKVFKAVPPLRELSFGQLSSLLKQHDQPEYEALAGPSVVTRLRPPGAGGGLSHAGLPVFVTSSTTLGFAFELGAPGQKAASLRSRIDGQNIAPFSRWFTRSGRFAEALSKIRPDKKDSALFLPFGRGDLVHPPASSECESTRTFIETLLKIRNGDRLDQCVSAVYTIPVFRTTLPELGLKESSPQGVSANLDEMSRAVISDPVFTQAKADLKTVLVPKTIRQGVVNLLSIYNQGIQDEILYGHVIELRPFIKTLLRMISLAARGKVKDPARDLYEVLHSFEYAFANRIYSSYRTWEVSDSNLYFKGGIQQLVTAYDGLYKAVSAAVGNPSSFAFIEGHPTIATWKWALRLNFFHVFQPELLATSVMTEAAMHYVPLRAEGASRKTLGRFTLSSLGADEFTRRFASRLRNPLREYLTPQWFNHVIADSFAFNLAYLRDESLFQYWYWGYFVSTTGVYERESKIRDSAFVSYLLRHLVVIRLNRGGRNVRLPRALGRLHKVHAANCAALVEELFERPEFSAWAEEVSDAVKRRAITCLGALPADYARSHESDFASVIDGFKRGVVHSYRPAEQFSPFRFTQLVLYSYLKLLADGQGRAVSVLRRENGAPRPREAQGFEFDPLGGVFISRMKTRREYFQYRNVLTMSLWDMAVKEKQQDWLEISSWPTHKR